MMKLSYEQNIKNFASLMSALSNPLRLRIFRLLLEGNFCVCELQMMLRVEQSRLSHQLKILRLSGLIDVTEEGRWSVYSVVEGWKAHPVIQALRESLPLGPEEKAAVEEFKQQSLRMKKIAKFI